MDKMFTLFFKRLSRFRKLKKHIDRLAMITAIICLIKERVSEKA